ncbi:hypothetical protein C817_00781 [Dorea sp. 5-2]|nr:hypothetical protein C817_00781 [Dorea sp. 5-2]
MSIHTPTQGVTVYTFAYFPIFGISIHTPTQGVTRIVHYKILSPIHFNPHSHTGSDRKYKQISPIIFTHIYLLLTKPAPPFPTLSSFLPPPFPSFRCEPPPHFMYAPPSQLQNQHTFLLNRLLRTIMLYFTLILIPQIIEPQAILI